MWIKTLTGLVRASEVEGVIIVKKEINNYSPQGEAIHTFAYVVMIRTSSGASYEVSKHLVKEEADIVLKKICKEVEHATYRYRIATIND